MAISEAMFAQALGAYIREHQQEFEKFLRERYPDDLEDWNAYGLEESERTLLFRMRKLSQDGSTLAGHDYAIKITRL